MMKFVVIISYFHVGLSTKVRDNTFHLVIFFLSERKFTQLSLKTYSICLFSTHSLTS